MEPMQSMESESESQNDGAELDAAFADDAERPLASEKAGELLEDFSAVTAGDEPPARSHEEPGRPRTRTRRRKKTRATERAVRKAKDPEPSAEPEIPELEDAPTAIFDAQWRADKAKPMAKLGKLIYRLWGKDKVLSDEDAREWGESAAECLAELGGMSPRVAKLVDASDKFVAPAVFVGLNYSLVDERMERDKVLGAERVDTVVGTLPRSSSANG